MSFDLFIHAGGYWCGDAYLGGEPYDAGKHVGEGFSISTIHCVVVECIGYDKNMRKVSWFPPESSEKREDLDDDAALWKAVHYGIGAGALTLFVVREDDPDISMRYVRSLSDDDGDEEGDVEGDGEGDGEGGGALDSDLAEFEQEADVNVDDYQEEDDDDSLCNERVEVDESKYRNFFLGQEYKSIMSFKSAVLKYAYKNRRDIRYHKTDSKRVVAICSDGACPWRISATINSSSTHVIVRALHNEHDCTWQGKVSLLTNARIAELFIEEFRLNPTYSAKQLQEKLLSKNINVSWSICERTRLRCLKKFDEEQAEQFARLHDYVYELKRSNKGSSVECEVRETRFYRFYVCFEALKDGWRSACRKIIHVDGTFLKWRMNGMLLVACGRDPNDQMFPVSWAIVDVENKQNWIWFMEHLVDDLGLGLGNGLTMASDQCKGLVAAVKVVLPYAEHRMCARHIYSNWKKRHSGNDLEDMFWAAAKAYYPLEFERKIKELKEYDPAAHTDLKLDVSSPWTRAYFSEYAKCDSVENNLGESFNAAIRTARTKPIVQMLESIRRGVMVCNEKKRLEAEKGRGDYTPRASALLDQQINLAKYCRPLPCGLGKYEVGYFNDSYIVHLKNEVCCSCRLYLISGIPCCHIVSALRLEKSRDQNPKSLIYDGFKREKLQRCYLNPLKPVNGMNLWKVTTEEKVKPPPYKQPPGRPPGKKRKREKEEPKPGKLRKTGIKMHCRICGQEGHNRTNCKNNPAPKPPKKPPGRPRKHLIEGSSSQPAAKSLGWKAWSDADVGSSSQPVPNDEEYEDLPSLSSAPPKKKRGRPRKNPMEGYGEYGSSARGSSQP